MTAEEYIARASASMTERYDGDCVSYACRVAELLLAERRSPWIGRIRDLRLDSGRVLHGALIPGRYAGRGGPAWTTHYVCGSGLEVYDPLAGVPLPASSFGESVFGRPIPIEIHLDVEATASLIEAGALRRAIVRGTVAHES